MVQKGTKGIRAAFADATAKLSLADGPQDPPPEEARDGVPPGGWPGAPCDRLPPGSRVLPLGISGKTSWFIDSSEQLIGVATNEWGKKMLLQLYARCPNFVTWAWPRWSESKKGKPAVINGVDVDDACACLMKAAADKGLFDPANRVRGRGAWATRDGELIWHAGEALYRVTGKKLEASAPGEHKGVFYPRRPEVMTPWPEPVPSNDSPARKIYECLTSWSWERPELDPLIALGGLGVMLLGGALPWRSHVATTGDAGTGKSTLNALIKGALDLALIDAANTTEAGVRQHMGLDSLPVAIDEFEASEDNRRVTGILELARIASSGGRMLRGGQDHKGVEFQARNAFFCSGIVLPPMKAQDKSRFAVLNLNKLKIGENAPPVISENDGRMILRSLMDAWPNFHPTYADWRHVLHLAGLDSRAQDTYGTLFTMVHLLLGHEALEDIGLPVTDATRLGELIAKATASERADRIDNWRACFERMISVPIEAWKGGEKPTIGGVLEKLEAGEWQIKETEDRLTVAGVRVIEEPDAALPAGKRRYLLCVPHASPALEKIFTGTRWSGGGWVGALRQGRESGVIRKDDKITRINRVPSRCVVVDLKAYDEVVGT